MSISGDSFFSRKAVRLNAREIDLLLISAVSLFLELALIRFIASTVQVIAYFNNFVILSAFLGLGFGSLLASKRPRNLLAYLPLYAVLFISFLVYLDSYGFYHDQAEQVVWTLEQAERFLSVPVVVAFVFFGNFLFFVPIGDKLGSCLGQFENRLVAYGYDLLGSLAGVVGFALMSYWRTPPWVWFSLGGLVVLFLLRQSRRSVLVLGGIWLIAVLSSLLPAPGIWSPYYKVTIHPYDSETNPPVELGYQIQVDKVRIQDALKFSPDLEGTPLASWVPYYELPFYFRRPGTTLILGGGAGNDTAIALANSAERVDVVEIDPVLVDLGSQLHPHRPYAQPAVRVIADDARAFLRRTSEKYDLVIMNALDSHHQLPGLSTLRLESYMYTVEAFRDVQRHLNPDALFLVHLSSTRPWMGERLFWSLTEAFGEHPRLFTTDGSPFGSIAFVYGPDKALAGRAHVNAANLQEIDPAQLLSIRDTVDLATDDWPHLYLSSRRIPRVYYFVLAAVVSITFVIFSASGGLAATGDNLHFFLLGASFMLLETRSLTQAALVFGSTWVVNAVVIGSILLVISIGNFLILKRWSPPKKLAYPLLLASLLALYFLPIEFILRFPFAVRVILTSIVVGTPIFFASLVFSYSFRRADNTARAFGSNLLGVVVGGSLEYSSMILGLAFLYILAFAIYALALLFDSDILPFRRAAT